MKTKKLNLHQLKVTSFVTSLENQESDTYKGGAATNCCEATFESCPSVPVNNCGIISYNSCITLPVNACDPLAPQQTNISGPVLCLRPQPRIEASL
jgi:hypothetical protein